MHTTGRSKWIRKVNLSATGICALSVVVFWLCAAILAPIVAPYTEAEMIADSYAPANDVLLLGADYLGRDVLSRILWGARVTIGIAISATIVASLIGYTLGIVAAVGGRYIDTTLSRINDVMLSMPHMMVGLIIVAALGSSVPLLIIMTGIIYAPAIFRISRALSQTVSTADFVTVARLRGEGLFWIVTREVLPNIFVPLMTEFGLRFIYVLLFVSSLSFLGLGVQPPSADWGLMVRENLQGLAYGSLSPIIPALAIGTLTVSVNVVMDELSSRRRGFQARENRQ